MTYQAIVVKIDVVKPHPDADRIQLALVLGYQVVVSLESKAGDVGLLFPDDGQLSSAYAEANNLIGIIDSEGNRKGGYFDQNRRVRAQKFRGEKSEAYFAPLSSLEFTGYDISKLKIGDRFDVLNSVHICNKYINTRTRNASQQNKNKKTKREKEFTKKFNSHLKNLFPEHFETDQFRHYADKIPHNSLITITSKLHGTSGRVSYIPVIVGKKWYEKIFDFITRNKEDKTEYKYVHGSRRVILTKDGGDGYYHNTNFRDNVLERFKGKLRKNEVVYFEIVGYCDNGKPIMNPVDTRKLKDKKFVKRFGEQMIYKYGCPECTCDIYVYRMCVVNCDGETEELPWNRVKQRCNEMGVNYVPEIVDPTIQSLPFIYNENDDGNKRLKDLVEYLTDDVDIADPIDNSHVREGICIRVDDPHGKTKIYKSKTFVFKILEGLVKDSGEEDMEEVESLMEEEV